MLYTGTLLPYLGVGRYIYTLIGIYRCLVLWQWLEFAKFRIAKNKAPDKRFSNKYASILSTAFMCSVVNGRCKYNYFFWKNKKIDEEILNTGNIYNNIEQLEAIFFLSIVGLIEKKENTKTLF